MSYGNFGHDLVDYECDYCKLGSGCGFFFIFLSIYFFIIKFRGNNTEMAATKESWDWNSTVAV